MEHTVSPEKKLRIKKLNEKIADSPEIKVGDAVEIGELLYSIKVENGITFFHEWVNNEMTFSGSMAEKYVKVYEAYKAKMSANR